MTGPFVVDPHRVAVYIRWSTEEQGEGTTREIQQESCRHYISARGWQWREDLVFVDEGYSGGSMERPGLTALRAAVLEDKISCVVVFKLDRLSRSVVDMVNLVLEEWDGRCYVQSTREPIDTTNPSSRMFFYVLSSFAEWERSVIRERTSAGQIKRAQQGKNPGFTPPFGYRVGQQPGEWTIEQREAAIVRRCFRDYLAGSGFRDIVRMLHREGFLPRRAKRWHPTTVAQMLSNPAYIGVLEYGRTTLAPKSTRRTGRPRRIQLPEPRHARIENAFPPLIERAVWEAVQQERKRRSAHYYGRAHASHYILSGVAFCGCGERLAGHLSVQRHRRYYRCLGQQRGWGGCGNAMVEAERLEAEVLSRVRQLFQTATRGVYLHAVRSQLALEVEQAQSLLPARQASLAEISRKRERLDVAFDSGQLPAKDYARRLQELEAEEGSLQTAIQAAEVQTERLCRTQVQADMYMQLADGVGLWDRLSLTERKQLLHHVVERVVVNRRSTGRRPNGNPMEIDLSLRQLTECKWPLEVPLIPQDGQDSCA